MSYPNSGKSVLESRILTERAGRIKSVPESFYLSAISVMALELGIPGMEHKDSAQGAVLRAWLDKHVLPEFNDRVLSVDLAVALRCGQLHTPDPGAKRDTLIAATALVHAMTVMTRNIADFRHSGVVLLNPWEPG